MLLVSDIHFGANRAEDVAAFERAASDGTNQDRIVVIAGDFTQDHKSGEFEDAAAFLCRLLEAGCVVIATPGNHDLGRWQGEKMFTNDRARARCRSLLAPVYDQPQVESHHDMDSITVVGDEVFVALRSIHRGPARWGGILRHARIRRNQIEWANRELSRLRREASIGASSRLHLVTHRSLWRDDGDKHSAVRRRRRLEAELLKPAGFVAYIHGHNHRFSAGVRTTPKLGLRLMHLSIPTLSTRARAKGEQFEYSRGWVNWRAVDSPPSLVEVAQRKPAASA